MGTRFYFPQTGSAAVSPAFDAGWENTSNSPNRFAAVTTRINSSSSMDNQAETSSSNTYDVLLRQYVSEPISAQTITGTIKGQFRCQEYDAADNIYPALVVKVVSNDGTTVRGTLYSSFGFGTEFYAASRQNRNFPPSTAVTSVVAQANDRIVIEIGYRATNTHTTGNAHGCVFGDNSGADLPENDETYTTADNPWIEFSQDVFQTVKSATDSGTGTEVLTVTYPAQSITDTGVGGDAITLTHSPALTDSASGTETITIEISAVIVSVTDLGSGSDTLSLAATIGLTDTGAGSDASANAIHLLKTVLDTIQMDKIASSSIIMPKTDAKTILIE